MSTEHPNLPSPSTSPTLVLRYLFLLLLDGIAAGMAVQAAFLLRFEGDVPVEYQELFRLVTILFVPARMMTNLAFGLHRWSFRRSGLNEAVRLAGATFAGTALLIGMFFFLRFPFVPRSIVALEFFFSTGMMAILRFSPRLTLAWYDDRKHSRKKGALRTLILGAGDAGDLLLRDLLQSKAHPYHVVGFVDDDPNKLRTSLGGKPVLGPVKALPSLVEKHQVSMVLIAIPELPAERIRDILGLCAGLKVNFKIIPTSFAVLDEKITAAMLHDLSPEDLLPRDAVSFDKTDVQAQLKGSVVLVTGAAGSIGGEIALQVAAHQPKTLALVDINENELYLLTRRLQHMHPGIEIRSLIADIRDERRLNQLGEMCRPQYVFHAAAHKHVPLMEEAPGEAIKNNVFGTLNVARMADAVGAKQFVLISTDKAVRPSSVMGASKRVAELVVRDLARRSKTSFTAVRFGNVLGSAGSVVPLFKEQIERGGPVTVTHPDCTRFFMTISEAVGLVLIAGLGDYGELCVLDMGQPIRIADLAANMITMAGLVPNVDIPIVYTGLRPGEKLTETLLTEEEEESHTVRNKIFLAKSPPPPLDLEQQLDSLRRIAEQGDAQPVRAALKALIPTYQVPEPTGVPVKQEKLATVTVLRAQGRS